MATNRREPIEISSSSSDDDDQKEEDEDKKKRQTREWNKYVAKMNSGTQFRMHGHQIECMCHHQPSSLIYSQNEYYCR